MNASIILWLTLGITVLVVIYQSRSEPFNFAVYFKRWINLWILLFRYGKEVGTDAVLRFREMNWNLDLVDK
uniref:Uncharacterized protein n=1 Tax=viral metagenome TaxID=1070528 RepID=A0A6C0BL13_9ZZZZ